MEARSSRHQHQELISCPTPPSLNLLRPQPPLPFPFGLLSMSNLPTTFSRYTLAQGKGFDGLSRIDEPLQQPNRKEVLVRVHAVSLQFRDLAIAKVRVEPKLPYSPGPCPLLTFGPAHGRPGPLPCRAQRQRESLFGRSSWSSTGACR